MRFENTHTYELIEEKSETLNDESNTRRKYVVFLRCLKGILEDSIVTIERIFVHLRYGRE